MGLVCGFLFLYSNGMNVLQGLPRGNELFEWIGDAAREPRFLENFLTAMVYDDSIFARVILRNLLMA